MKFILSQELSRHNRDKKCRPIDQQMDYKTYEISYETIEILPAYTIIAASDTQTVEGSDGIANVSPESSEILVIPPILHENDFTVDESVHPTSVENTNVIGTVKSWNCGLCAFR